MKLWRMVLLGTVALGVMGGTWLWTPDKSRADLERKYLQRPEDMLDVAGLQLHVRDSGQKDRPAVIMLHGFGSSLHTWEAWAKVLAQDHRVVRFDLPSAGLTGRDPTDDYSDTRGMAVLVALMDKLQIPRASLIGNSIGGRIAWRFAAQYPGRVDRLVLVSPDGFASAGFEYGKATKLPALFGVMRYVLPKPVLRMTLASAYANRDLLCDDVVTRYHDLMLAPGVREASIKRLEQTVLEPPEPWLRRIQAPVLLVWGEKDAIIPVTNAEDYRRALPQSTLVVLPGLGHVPQEEAPAASLPKIAAFLAG